MDAGSEPQRRDALAEGRRIYMGNLLYSVQPGDVEDLLRQSGFAESFEKLHISIDPVSGRNPGYCFAEFTTREEADRALETLPGSALFNRQIKVGPCNPKTPSSQSRGWGVGRGGGDRGEGGHNPTFQRWGDWKGDDSKPARREGEQGPYGAIRHLDNRSQRTTDKAQLYIGGLGMMTSQEQHDAEMQEILAGFELYVITSTFPRLCSGLNSHSPALLSANGSLRAPRPGRHQATTTTASLTLALRRRPSGRCRS